MIAANPCSRLATPAFIAAVLTLALAVPAAASAADFSLTVEPTGSGSGAWECEVQGGGAEPCEAEYAQGTELTVLPKADPGSEFVEFSGDCGPLGCFLTMDEDHTATVLFEALEGEAVPLTVETFGGGSGTVECEVEAGPAEPCEAEYAEGTEISLVAEADPGSEFVEWLEDCSGAGPCELTMDEEHSVTALFEPEAEEFALNIEEPGSGSGTVECEAQEGLEPCQAVYPAGTELIVLATADPGSEFLEFGGDCGPAECELTMDEEHGVSVLFEEEASGEFSLTINKAGTGAGTVECEVEGAEAEPCEGNYAEGTEIGLVATANPGSTFAGFSAGTGSATACSTSPCSFAIEANSSLTATFNTIVKPKFKLTVTKSGTGTGTVTSTPAGINCGSGAGCEAEYDEGTEVTLSQSASAGSEFKEWTGACTGSGACKVTISAAKAVGAKFDLIARSLSITKAGSGTGEVKCKVGAGSAEACAASYPNGTALKVEATANAGSTFAGYSAGTGSASVCATSPCSFTLEANSSLTATFNIAIKPKFKLTVTKSGSGTGTITGGSVAEPAAINCGSGAGCEAEFEEGTEVTLSPSPSAGSEFKEWTGACTGSGACKVTMGSAKNVGAKFDLIARTLSITKAGSGTGEVKCKVGAGPAEPCAASYPNGTALKVEATANAGSTFAGYSAGTGSAVSCTASPCSFTIEADSSVTATFNPVAKPKFKLTVTKSGSGTGTISGGSVAEPATINCGSGAGCEAEFDEGTEVTLSSAASAGSQFTEWSGACTGSGACKVTMSAAKAVGAKFDLIAHLPEFTLTIEVSGNGSGLVSCDGGACAATYKEGAEVTLSATAISGSTFAGWSGEGCSGTGACKVTIEADTTIVAKFSASPFTPPPPPFQKGTALAAGIASVQGESALIRLLCPLGARCTGTLELFAKLSSPSFGHRHFHHGPPKSTLIGTASFDLPSQGRATVAVKITSARALRILARSGVLSAQLLGTSVRSRTVRLVAPWPRRHHG